MREGGASVGGATLNCRYHSQGRPAPSSLSASAQHEARLCSPARTRPRALRARLRIAPRARPRGRRAGGGSDGHRPGGDANGGFGSQCGVGGHKNAADLVCAARARPIPCCGVSRPRPTLLQPPKPHHQAPFPAGAAATYADELAALVAARGAPLPELKASVQVREGGRRVRHCRGRVGRRRRGRGLQSHPPSPLHPLRTPPRLCACAPARPRRTRSPSCGPRCRPYPVRGRLRRRR